MKRRAWLILLAACCAAGCASEAAESIIVKASSSSAAREPTVLALERFGQDVAARTGGRLRIDVYPNNALGSEREVIELTILGAVEMVSPSNAPLTTFAPELLVFDLPYLFRDRHHMYAVLDGPIGQAFAEPLRRRGLVLLGYFEAGFRHLMTRNRRVERLEDLRGLKIRTMENPLHLLSFRTFGASPIPMAYGEVYTALEQGVIDGAEAANSNYYSQRFFEVAPHWSKIGWMYLVSPLIMSARFFDGLSPEDQMAIREAAATAVAWEREEYQRQEDTALVRLSAAGVTISRPDREEFLESARRVWLESGGTVDMALIEQILATDTAADTARVGSR